MTSEEAIKELRDASDSEVRYGDTEHHYNEVMKRVEAFDMAIQVLVQTKWIPVSERLPKENEYIGNVAKYYLVQNEYGDMLVARYTHSDYWEQMYQLKPIADEIVAWMPLPEPYRSESE